MAGEVGWLRLEEKRWVRDLRAAFKNMEDCCGVERNKLLPKSIESVIMG